MLIRKLFKYESAHVVRNCSSQRCSHNIHGHSYKVEVLFECDELDDGGMILDFGLTKGLIGSFIDGFDHGLQAWSKDQMLVNIAKESSERVIILPVNPSAENYALMFTFVVDKILGAIQFGNGEGDVRVHSVIVHETDTGYAQAFRSDLSMVNYTLDDIEISEQTQLEYKDPQMWVKLKEYYKNIDSGYFMGKPFINPIVDHYIIN